MTAVRAFLRLPRPRRRLVREAVRALLATRLRRVEGSLFREVAGRHDDAVADEVAWAVRVAARGLPGTWNCLPQARATSRMLERRGVAHRVLVGARHSEGFEAHAWVEHAGRVVVGDLPDLAEYRSFSEGP